MNIAMIIQLKKSKIKILVKKKKFVLSSIDQTTNSRRRYLL